jgi:hypothetical protein
MTETLDEVIDRNLTSPADLLTMVSYQCSIQVLRLLCTVHNLYAFYEWSIMAVCRVRPLESDENRE